MLFDPPNFLVLDEPTNPGDSSADPDADGYTNLEDYLEELAQRLIGRELGRHLWRHLQDGHRADTVSENPVVPRASGHGRPSLREAILCRVSPEPEIVSSRTLADGWTILTSARGRVEIGRIGSGVVSSQCRGALSGKFYAPTIAVVQRELDSYGSLRMFVDGWDLKSIDTEYRERWTEWFKVHRERFHMQLLVRTKLMEMAASIANLLTGASVVKTYSNAELWEQACLADFPAFRPMGRKTD